MASLLVPVSAYNPQIFIVPANIFVFYSHNKLCAIFLVLNNCLVLSVIE